MGSPSPHKAQLAGASSLLVPPAQPVHLSGFAQDSSGSNMLLKPPVSVVERYRSPPPQSLKSPTGPTGAPFSLQVPAPPQAPAQRPEEIKRSHSSSPPTSPASPPAPSRAALVHSCSGSIGERICDSARPPSAHQRNVPALPPTFLHLPLAVSCGAVLLVNPPPQPSAPLPRIGSGGRCRSTRLRGPRR
eukprot:m51a1_g12861 hypothetical protein (189) ;mRNA; f:2667-3303